MNKAMPPGRTVEKMVEGTRQVDGAGVRLLRVIARDNVVDFDPFLMLDAFDSVDPQDYVRGFPWHPHRGIETVTYLIAGDVEHGDSLGNRGHILDGGCQWMTGGGGIIHQEMPQASPRMLGMQLWLNLPRQHKMAPPEYRDLKSDRIPQVAGDGVRVAVVAGRHGNVCGPAQGDYVRLLMLDVALEPGASFRTEVDGEATAFAYVVEGTAQFGGHHAASARQAVLFRRDGEDVTARAGEDGARFALFAARPLREPVAWGGPIVMNTQEELRQAFEEIEAGTFIRPARGLP